MIGDPPKPTGWHYQRQLELVAAGDAPSGKNYVTFRNADARPRHQALQGFAVDGRKIRQLELSFRVRGKELRPASAKSPFPRVRLVFYDDNRAEVTETTIGAWRDSFEWAHGNRSDCRSGPGRECIIQIGLAGGLGEISFDAFTLKGLKEPARSSRTRTDPCKAAASGRGPCVVMRRSLAAARGAARCYLPRMVASFPSS